MRTADMPEYAHSDYRNTSYTYLCSSWSLDNLILPRLRHKARTMPIADGCLIREPRSKLFDMDACASLSRTECAEVSGAFVRTSDSG